MTYKPQAGTIPDRAIKHLQALGKGAALANAVLADELGVDKNALHASLATPVKHGAMAREKRASDGLIYWSIGDGTPAPLPHDFEPDEPLHPRSEPKTRRTRGQGLLAMHGEGAQEELFDEPLFCKFSDGRIGIKAEGHDLTFSSKTSNLLETFLRTWPPHQ